MSQLFEAQVGDIRPGLEFYLDQQKIDVSTLRLLLLSQNRLTCWFYYGIQVRTVDLESQQ